MKTYYIIWHYYANYPDQIIEVCAESPEAAIIKATGIYLNDFRQGATVFVFDSPPILIQSPNEKNKTFRKFST